MAALPPSPVAPPEPASPAAVPPPSDSSSAAPAAPVDFDHTVDAAVCSVIGRSGVDDSVAARLKRVMRAPLDASSAERLEFRYGRPVARARPLLHLLRYC